MLAPLPLTHRSARTARSVGDGTKTMHRFHLLRPCRVAATSLTFTGSSCLLCPGFLGDAGALTLEREFLVRQGGKQHSRYEKRGKGERSRTQQESGVCAFLEKQSHI